MNARALRARCNGSAVRARGGIRHGAAGQVTQQREFAQLLLGEREPGFRLRIEFRLVPQRHGRVQERARGREPHALSPEPANRLCYYQSATVEVVALSPNLSRDCPVKNNTEARGQMIDA